MKRVCSAAHQALFASRRYDLVFEKARWHVRYDVEMFIVDRVNRRKVP